MLFSPYLRINNYEEETEQITINQLVRVLTEKGFRISYRTFWYYIERWVFPKPRTGKGEKGVHGYYPADILEPIEKVLRWRDEGHRLDELAELLRQDTDRDIGTIFKENDLEGPFLPDDLVWKSPEANRFDSASTMRREPTKLRAHEEKEYRARIIRDNLTEETMWRSRGERERIVLERVVEILEHEWSLGYFSAMGDVHAYRFDFDTLKDNPEMVKFEECLERRYRNAQERIRALKAKLGRSA